MRPAVRPTRLLAGLLLLAASACGTGAGSDAVPAEAAAAPEVSWATVYRDGTIRVTIEDPGAHYRVSRVTLFAPDGTQTEAAEITRENLSRGSTGGDVRPSVGVGGGYSSHGGFGTGVGIGLSFPLGGGTADREPEARRTTAILPVANTARYRQTAGGWEIQATLTSPGDETTYARFPAPIPAEQTP